MKKDVNGMPNKLLKQTHNVDDKHTDFFYCH